MGFVVIVVVVMFVPRCTVDVIMKIRLAKLFQPNLQDFPISPRRLQTDYLNMFGSLGERNMEKGKLELVVFH